MALRMLRSALSTAGELICSERSRAARFVKTGSAPMSLDPCALAARNADTVVYAKVFQLYKAPPLVMNVTLRSSVDPGVDSVSSRMSPTGVVLPAVTTALSLLMLSPTTAPEHAGASVPSRLMPAVKFPTTVLPTTDSPGELRQSSPWSP